MKTATENEHTTGYMSISKEHSSLNALKEIALRNLLPFTLQNSKSQSRRKLLAHRIFRYV